MNGLLYFKELINKSKRWEQNKNYFDLLAGILKINPENKYIFSTAEHLSTFNYASTISNIYPLRVIHSLYPELFDEIICMAGSLIPLDNEDYPRGIIAIDCKKEPIRINLKSKSFRKCFPLALDSDDLPELMKKRLETLEPALKELIYSSIKQPGYTKQILYIMTKLYEKWKIPDSRLLPLKVYPLEEVACKILQELILNDNPLIYSILFDIKVREYVYNALKGVLCAWDDRKGSFLFWYHSNQKLYQMREINGYLVTNNSYKVKLTPTSIIQSIKNKEIFPCGFLSLVCVSYLPSIPVIGGHNQFFYYRSMIKMLNSLNIHKRSLDLSLYGYDVINFKNFQIESRNHIPEEGAGVYLALNETDINTVIKNLEEVKIIMPEEDENDRFHRNGLPGTAV